METPAAIAVSAVQTLATFLIVYPPPPSSIRGKLKDFINSTHLAWPFEDKLKHPNLSPDRLSAPHCNTIAPGRYHCITYDIIGSNIEAYDSSSIPSLRGKLIE